MKILRRSRWLRDLKVIASSQLKESFYPRARMLGALAFITVRQEQHQPGKQVPLGFTGHYELINDGLRNIGEVAELRLPQHQHFREIAAVAIFKTQDSSLRE